MDGGQKGVIKERHYQRRSVDCLIDNHEEIGMGSRAYTGLWEKMT